MRKGTVARFDFGWWHRWAHPPCHRHCRSVDQAQPRRPNRIRRGTGRMEMERIPAAGYAITGLPITGIDRKSEPTQPRVSLAAACARSSGPAHHPAVSARRGRGRRRVCQWALALDGIQAGIPTLIQEQNGFPGITNRLLAQRVDKVCAGFPGLSTVVSSRENHGNRQSTAAQHCRAAWRRSNVAPSSVTRCPQHISDLRQTNPSCWCLGEASVPLP